MERTGSTSYATEKVENKTESVRTIDTENIRAEQRGSEDEQSYTRRIEFDSAGRVQTVSETWRDRRLSNFSTEERDARVVSVVDTEISIETKDTLSVDTQELSNIDTDSRPIQGIEWMWVILSVVLIATVIIYIIYNRVK